MSTTSRKSAFGKFVKKVSAITILMGTAMTGYALEPTPVSAQSTPDVILYSGANFTGRAVRISSKRASLGRFNNKASSIKVLNNQRWRFWQGKNFTGRSITLGRGNYRRIILNNNIESLRGLK